MHYIIAGTFKTDRVLTREEIDTLVGTIFVQVDEPVDNEGERAEWTATDVFVRVVR